MVRNHFRNKNYLHVRGGGGSLRFYLGFGGSHHVLIVFPTSSQICSQCIPQVPNVFPLTQASKHFRNKNYLHVKGGGEFEILFGFWWFPPCSHSVPNRFPMVLNNALNIFPTGSQCGSPPPPPPKGVQQVLEVN
jgi:hypothetical protein